MPYAFAHPAAVIPLARLLGRRAVPSALAIGSMAPDAWYFVPLLTREHGHGLPGALWFSLPAALVAYAAFHLVFKEPLLALLPRPIAGRLAAYTPRGLPAVSWLWVVVSALAGIATHVLWDSVTHRGHIAFLERLIVDGVPVYRALQHASTVAASGFLGWWLWRKLRATRPGLDVPAAPRLLQITVLAVMLLVPAAAFLAVLEHFEPGALRAGLRAGALTAAGAFGFVALSFALLWRLSPRLRARPRPRARASSTARPR